jgi:hypothetical protein
VRDAVGRWEVHRDQIPELLEYPGSGGRGRLMLRARS